MFPSQCRGRHIITSYQRSHTDLPGEPHTGGAAGVPAGRLYEKYVGTEDIISLVDNAKVLENYKTKIKVSVQNLVEEMRDILSVERRGRRGWKYVRQL